MAVSSTCLPALIGVVTVALLTNATSPSGCPAGCGCHQSNQFELTIDCHQMAKGENYSTKLFEEIDAMLSQTNESSTPSQYGELTSLEIIDSPLTDVPPSICRLRALRHLCFDRNQLTQLPGDCFVHMPQLVNLTAINNAVTVLQDGLFDGLTKLELIDLSMNRISTIGSQVFANESDLPSLRTVHLAWNLLTVLDAWPIVRGRVARKAFDREAFVGLSNNHIANVTNVAGVPVGCGYKAPYMTLDLSFNNLPRVSTIAQGWGISSITDVLCLLGIYKWYSRPTFFQVDFTLMADVICDCVDFTYYSADHLFHKSQFFYKVYCSQPTNLHGREISRIPMDEFVCDVTERCPTSCRCVSRPSNSTLHIYCSSTNMTRLPAELPPLPKTNFRYKIELQNSLQLSVIEDRSYLASFAIFDASYAGTKLVDPQAWRRLVTTDGEKRILLKGNHLETLPRDVVTATNISRRVFISLDGNPWSCSCDDRWMAPWLKSVKQQLINPEGILCNSPGRLRGRNVLQIPEKEFCINPATAYAQKVIPASVSGVCAITAIVLFVAYRLRFSLFVRWKFHPFDRDECIGEDMDYDVFLCCSFEDHSPHGQAVLRQLESKGYRVCYHLRDFPAGQVITDNIYYAIVHSKRTVCLLSRSFVSSAYCLHEFDVAYHHSTCVLRKKRLIVLMMLDDPLATIDSSEDTVDEDGRNLDTSTVRQYLRQYTYIDDSTDEWFDRLLYALPLNGILQRRQLDHDANEHETGNSPLEDDVPILR